jgi:hypothetical protein
MDLNVGLLTTNASMFGRLNIWSFYLEKLFDSGIHRILFGFGPGVSLRITEGTYLAGQYAHSSILDYVFTYGVCGGVIVINLITQALKRVKETKSILCGGLLVLCLLMFFPFGTCQLLSFHMMLALTSSRKEFGLLAPNKEF